MDFDRKENFSYLDGVPLKIGSKFCPPREIPLPLAFSHQLPKDILAEKYDFSLEKKVLETERKRKMEEEVAKDVKVGSEIENFSKAQTEETGNGAASIVANPSVGAGNQNSTIWHSNSILQPKPQVLSNSLEFVPPAGSNNLKKFNLSDFENDSSSPFDYMELQTINDLEELSTVFQGINENNKAPLESNGGNGGSRYYVPASSSILANNVDETRSQTVGIVSKSVSFPLPQHLDLANYKTDSDSENKTERGVSSTTSSAWSISKNADNHLSYSYPSVSGLTNDFSRFVSSDVKAKPNNILNDSTYPALSQVPCISSNTGRSGSSFESNEQRFPVSKSSGLLRSSKSVSDLHNLVQNDTDVSPRQERSYTPPANVLSDQQHASPVEKFFVNKHLQYQTVPKDILSSNGLLTANTSHPDFCPDLPDPYYELSSEEKQTVDSITDMGFHRSQVARTVKHLGTDEKKVVEHLCQIQVLEESGYDRLEAEAALHLHDYDKNEAIRFLDLLNQFQDLGFEKDAIKKALVQNKNDRDKVIDALLS